MIKTAKELADACVDVACNYKTLYVSGCWGAPMTAANKERWMKEQSYNRRTDRQEKILRATEDTFGFDCVNLIKGLLWGWSGDKNHRYGGAGYSTNGVLDINEELMFNTCTDVSEDFSSIEVGEAVWMPGHIGIYVGGGLAVECTPIWKDGVQITACNCKKEGFNTRNWVKHGKLSYVTYENTAKPEPERWYRIRKTWEDAGSQIGAYKDIENAKAGCPEGYNVYDLDGRKIWPQGGGTYGLTEFVTQVQKTCGAAVDGVAGAETLQKTVTISATINRTHAVVAAVQSRLYDLGYTEVGEADGEAGPKFTSALAHFQKDNGCTPSGIAEEWGKTWQKLLGMA